MAHNIPNGLKYTEEHEWAQLDGDVLTIGITDFAQSSLGDIVFVELPEVGSQLELGGTFGVVESIKSVSDLFSPVTGEVVEANDALSDSPELLNSDPYASAWMIKVKISDSSELDKLLSDSQYIEICENS
jgi:glycine cleavage system H protein